MRQKLQIVSLFTPESGAEVPDRGCVPAPASSHTKFMPLLRRVPREWAAICANASPFLGKHFTEHVLLTGGQRLCAVCQGLHKHT